MQPPAQLGLGCRQQRRHHGLQFGQARRQRAGTGPGAVQLGLADQRGCQHGPPVQVLRVQPHQGLVDRARGLQAGQRRVGLALGRLQPPDVVVRDAGVRLHAAVARRVGHAGQRLELGALCGDGGVEVVQRLVRLAQPAQRVGLVLGHGRARRHHALPGLLRLPERHQRRCGAAGFELQHAQVLAGVGHFGAPVEIGRVELRELLRQCLVAQEGGLGLVAQAAAAGDEADPVFALRVVEHVLRLARVACQQFGRAGGGFGEALRGVVEPACLFGDLAHQVQRACAPAQRCGVQRARALRGVVGQRAVAHGVERVEPAHRLQLGRQVAEHELDQPFGLRLLALRLAAFVHRHGGAGGQRQRRSRAGAHGHAVAAQELGAAVGPGVGPRGDGRVREVPAQVVGQRGGVGIAFGGLLLQRLRDDGVEVALQRMRAACGVGPARLQHGLRHQRRRAFDHRLPVRQRVAGLAFQRQPAAEQAEQQHAQRVDVGGGGDLAALQLLGRGVLRREGVAGLLRERAVAHTVGRRVEQLGDAEVEQLHLARRGDEDVRRLQVAVQDQPVVRVRHRVQHVQHQVQPRGQRQVVRGAELVDGQARHVFQHQVGLAGPGGGQVAGVEQPRDVRVRQPRHDAALAREALGAGGREQPGVEELDRHLGLEAAVGALRQPDAAHAAAADLAHQRVRAHGLAGQPGRWRQGRGLQEAAVVQARELVEPGRQFGRQCGVVGLQGRQARRALGGRQVQQRVEQRRQHLPACAVHRARRHQRSATRRNSRALCQSRCTVRSVTSRLAAISASVRPPK